MDTMKYAAFDACVNLFYMADVLLTFRTTYMDLLSGLDVTDSYEIAKQYVSSGNFFVDFLSSIPLDTIFGHPLWNAVGLLKIFRYRRLAELITKGNMAASIKVQLKLVFVIYQAVLYMHISSSLWCILVARNEKWTILYNYIYPYTTE